MTAISAFSAPHTIAQAPAPDSTPQTRKLYKECQQFESILISSLWNEMEQGVGIADNGNDPGAGTMQGLGIQSAALGLASTGGLGIARMIYQRLAPRLASEDQAQVAAPSGKTPQGN